MTIFKRVERAHRIGDWCTIDDLMEELQSFRFRLYEGGRYIPYLGVPCGVREASLLQPARIRRLRLSD